MHEKTRRYTERFYGCPCCITFWKDFENDICLPKNRIITEKKTTITYYESKDNNLCNIVYIPYP